MPIWPFKDDDSGDKPDAPYSNRRSTTPTPAPARPRGDPNKLIEPSNGMIKDAVKGMNKRHQNQLNDPDI